MTYAAASRGGRPVRVVPYDPEWVDAFRALRGEIRGALRDDRLEVDHIGSTSVPGLWAKPVIDVLLEAPDLGIVENHTSALERLGFEARGEYGIPGRRYFRRGPDGRRMGVHLHAFAAGHPHADWHRAFRDGLRSHPAVRADYARLKRELATRFADDRTAYQDAKAPFIAALRRRWAGSGAQEVAGAPGAPPGRPRR